MGIGYLVAWTARLLHLTDDIGKVQENAQTQVIITDLCDLRIITA
jgi:hypothetical protein